MRCLYMGLNMIKASRKHRNGKSKWLTFTEALLDEKKVGEDGRMLA